MVHRNALRRAVAALPVLPAVLALSACGVMPGGGPPVVTERWDDTHAVARGDAILRDAMLAGHNAARRAVGITPLRWDPALVADAAAYAQELARTRRFAHAPHDPAKVQGENLWMGTRGAYAYQEMIGAWVAERRYYRPGKVPNNSNTGNPADVGHYTQVVWRTTTRVGCATASNASDDYLVCRYTPAGNVVGVAPL